MRKATEKALLHEVHLVLGMVLVMAAIVVIVRLPGRGEAQVASPSIAERMPSVVVPFDEIAQGSKSTITKRVNYIVTSSDQMDKLWKMLDAKGAPPSVDFTVESVIAVFAGQKPTAGYSIRVFTIEDANTRLVSVALAKPDKNCAVAQSITTPYQLVKVSASSLLLAHEDTSTTADCK